MKTKCMSCGGPTKKMQNGGTKGAPKKIQKQGPIKTIKTMRNALKKINTDLKTKTGCFGAGCSKMQNGGSCFDKVQRKNKRLQNGSKVGRVLKNIGKGVLGTGLAVGAGVIAYKKSTPFKNAVDNVKDKLGLQNGGVLKSGKMQLGGFPITAKAAARKVAKGKGMMSYTYPSKDAKGTGDNKGAYMKFDKKQDNSNPGFKSFKGQPRRVLKSGGSLPIRKQKK